MAKIIILIFIALIIGYSIGVKHKRFITNVRYYSPIEIMRMIYDAQEELSSGNLSDYDTGVAAMADALREKI